MTVAMNGSHGATQTLENSADVATADKSCARETRPRVRRVAPSSTNRYASDDEILGIESAGTPARASASRLGSDLDDGNGTAEAELAPSDSTVADDHSAAPTDSAQGGQTDPQIQAAIDAHPQLQQAWQDAHSYREAFATPEEARAATALLGDLNRMDALFFSHRPEDHAELARAVAGLDPAAFASLAQAMTNLAAGANQSPESANSQPQLPAHQTRDPLANRAAAPNSTPAHLAFLHAANAAAVQGVLDSIETQVDRLLPEGVSKTARNRVIGEIYRELDASLGTNRQLGQQMRDAFRSGNLDAQHQRAVVSIITGRARQALPGIAKRVMNEWTSTVVAANQDRIARQRAAAHRVDIAGSGRGADGARRSLGPRDIDYNRLSDSDILNM
ncbi:MAG: hypothetical protein ACRD4X_08960 [Candidatus Acidiferrales bacterium]